MARTFLLLLLIAVVVAGGLVWFDHLNLIDVKTTLAPLYRLVGLEGRSQPKLEAGEFINIDAERLAVRLEVLALREMEIEKQSQETEGKRAEVEQMAAELETRTQELDERERTMNASGDIKEIFEKNLEQNARYLASMPPQNAVNILLAGDDQAVINVLRKTEEIAKAEGTASLVSVWLQNMPPERAADIQRKMTERPD